MRTFRTAIILSGLAAIVGLSHCGPIAPSLQKGTPGFGSLASLSTTKAVSDDDLSITMAEVVSRPGEANPENPRVTHFKNEGQIEIPGSNDIDLSKVSVTIGVNLSSDQIKEKNIQQLALKAVVKNDVVYLIIAPQGESAGAVIRPLVTSVKVKTDGTSSAFKKPLQEMN